jgi:hypothetical protein
MDNYELVFLVALIAVLFIGYIGYVYYSSAMGSIVKSKKETSRQDGTKQAPSRHDARHDAPTTPVCDKDINRLKAFISDAVNAIRLNITLIKSENILALKPYILLTKYPFYITILRLPKYMAANPCIGKQEFNKAVRELYGNDLEESTQLHVNIPDYHNYFILLDLNDAMEYYYKHRLEDIDELI